MRSLTRCCSALALLALPLLGACSSSNPYQGLDAPKLLSLGKDKFASRDWDDAIRALDRLILSFGDAQEVAEARLLMARAYSGKGDHLTARSEFQRFLDRFPGHTEAPAAALGICSSLVALSPSPQRDQNYTTEAITLCRNVVVDYVGTPQAEEAGRLAGEMRMKLAEKEFLSADFYFRRKLFDSAIIYYQFVVDLYGDTDWAPKALLGIYRSNKAIGYDDLANEAKERLLSQYPDSPAAAEVRANGAGA
ncbi:MAG: outer membrane protein assembly factor BamD [Gemmatimonadetes bacterium]|nr:outer membrane protein assembly factor BamD [Gemmatimonadota bacterium]